jgi:hypothetical protein
MPPTIKKAIPVRIAEYKNALSNNDGKNKAKTKKSRGINPITINETKVIVADFKGELLSFLFGFKSNSDL